MGCQASGVKVEQEPAPLITTPKDCIDVFLRYEFQGLLGTGSTSQVYEATDRKSGETFVVKCFVKQEVSRAGDRDLEREASILREMKHEHICRLREVFEDSLISYFVLEPCMEGKLFDRLEADIVLEEEEAARIAGEMVSAAAYIHDRHVVHRDMKPENWLITESSSGQGHVKLVNFGTARRCKSWDFLTEPCGTLHYVAPEVLRGSYSHPIDMWTLGVVIFLTIYATYPFDGESCSEVIKSILGHDPDWSDSCYALSPVALDFLKQALTKDPANRITPSLALNHAWIASAYQGAAVDKSHSTGGGMKTRPSLRLSGKSGSSLVVGLTRSASIASLERRSLKNPLPQIKGPGNRRLSAAVTPDVVRAASKLSRDMYKKSGSSGNLDLATRSQPLPGADAEAAWKACGSEP